MNLRISEQSGSGANTLTATRDLYQRYGGMMLGYLTDVVKDKQLAEDYLVDIFSALPEYVEDSFSSDRGIWVQLQSLAKAKLASFFDSLQDCQVLELDMHERWTSNGSPLVQLNPLQRTVFCGVYYHHKTLSRMAVETHQTEDTVKRILREVFIIIRNDR